MIIIYLEILVAICLIVVQLIMGYSMKKRNEAWFRTIWAKESCVLQKLNKIDEKIGGDL